MKSCKSNVLTEINGNYTKVMYFISIGLNRDLNYITFPVTITSFFILKKTLKLVTNEVPSVKCWHSDSIVLSISVGTIGQM